MEQRNWQVWLAIALGGLALLVALSGRSAPLVQNYEFARPDVGSYAQPPQPPLPPQAVQPGMEQPVGPDAGSGFRYEYRGSDSDRPSQREFRRSDDNRHGPFMSIQRYEHFRGGPFGHGPFAFGPFLLISIAFKLAGIALLLFLLVRLFKKQKASATPPAGN